MVNMPENHQHHFSRIACRPGWSEALLPKLSLGCLLAASLLFVLHYAAADSMFTLEPAIIAAAEKEYGEGARRRLLAWQQLVREDGGGTDLDKLRKVNDFFNSVDYITDMQHWQKKDYWATPIEFLASDGGDCEDFSLAKYFTLKLLGVAESKLKMTYVKAWKINQAHMVVTYYRTPEAEPLVLDNLVKAIEPASRRTDLLPVYSFNGAGLWLAKQRGQGKMVGGSDRLGLWSDLLSRMPASVK